MPLPLTIYTGFFVSGLFLCYPRLRLASETDQRLDQPYPVGVILTVLTVPLGVLYVCSWLVGGMPFLTDICLGFLSHIEPLVTFTKAFERLGESSLFAEFTTRLRGLGQPLGRDLLALSNPELAMKRAFVLYGASDPISHEHSALLLNSLQPVAA